MFIKKIIRISILILLISTKTIGQKIVKDNDLRKVIDQNLKTNSEPKEMLENIKSISYAIADQIYILDQKSIPPLTISQVRNLKNNLPKAVYIIDSGHQGHYTLDIIDKSTQDNTGTILRTSSNKCYKRLFSGGVDIGWFAKGDGVTDDRIAIQKAIDYASNIGTYIYDTGNHNYLITNYITLKRNLTGVILNGIINVKGKGYTAIKTEAGFRYKRFQIEINGQGNQVNGLELSNPQISQFQAIRIYNCNGFGLKIIKSWDCIFENISIELCGNNLNYAFSIEDGDDTSNMTSVLRLQVEQSIDKAIYISPKTLSSIFNNIHSERLKIEKTTNDSWYLGGASCTYNNIRLNALDNKVLSGTIQCHIDGANTSLTDIRVEGNINVIAESSSNSNVYLNAVTFPTFKRINSGTIYINKGEINLLNGNTNTLHITNVKSNTVNLGFSADDKNALNYKDGIIRFLTSSDPTAKIKADNTYILSGNFAQSATYLHNCTFNIGSSNASYRRVYLFNTTLIGNLTTDNGHFEFLNESKIQGNLTIGPSRSIVFDAHSYVTGTIKNMGIPESSLYSGGYYIGQRIWNPKPTDKEPEYWTCIGIGIDGKPGKWIAHY